MNSAQKLALLETINIFSPLQERELDIIAENSSFRTLKKGDIVFESGSPGTALYMVETGEILITRTTEDKKQIDVARFISGELFGEMELLENGEHNATAVAETDTTLLQFPKEGLSFQEVLQSYPKLSARILHTFLQVIAGRIRNTNALIKENSPLVQELKKQVYGDKLTGLLNKTFLEENLGSYLNDPASPVALLMVKPDNFKWINDNCGHEAGDKTLQKVAAALQETVEEEDVVIRYMGNELCIIHPGAGREEAVSFAGTIKSTLTELDVQEITETGNFHLSVSIGISLYPDHTEKSVELIEKAHALPLLGRARGGNTILFPEDNDT
jgi:diguanylate cyclase